MGAGNWFWIIYVICLIFGLYCSWDRNNLRPFGQSLVIMILLGLLGWGIFGPPIK